jgi:hypothetical protein
MGKNLRRHVSILGVTIGLAAVADLAELATYLKSKHGS